MANNNGHWYTDTQGNHYFVENGQSPKEGWEASKRRKMISEGKYKVSEDGNNYREVDQDEYDKYEADETDFDLDNEDDFGFDDEENVPEYEYSEIFSDSADKQIERYAEHYGVDASELKDEIYQKALDEIREGGSLSNARNNAMEEVLDSLDPGSEPLDDKEYNEEMTKAQEENAAMSEGENESKEDLDDGIPHEPVDMPKYHKEGNHIIIDEGPNKGDRYDSEEDYKNSIRSGEGKKETPWEKGNVESFIRWYLKDAGFSENYINETFERMLKNMNISQYYTKLMKEKESE